MPSLFCRSGLAECVLDYSVGPRNGVISECTYVYSFQFTLGCL